MFSLTNKILVSQNRPTHLHPSCFSYSFFLLLNVRYVHLCVCVLFMPIEFIAQVTILCRSVVGMRNIVFFANAARCVAHNVPLSVPSLKSRFCVAHNVPLSVPAHKSRFCVGPLLVCEKHCIFCQYRWCVAANSNANAAAGRHDFLPMPRGVCRS